MALPKPPKPKLPGSRQEPTPNQKRRPKKPRAIEIGERVAGFIDKNFNPFD